MPELTEGDFTNRIQEVRKLMAQRGYSALVVYSDMRALGGGNCFYLSNFHPSLEFPTVVVVPKDGDLCLIAHPGFHYGTHKAARRTSWVKDVRGVALGWSVDFAKHAREALEERGLATAKIGIVGVELMSKILYDRLHDELPNAALEEAPGIVEEVRKTKSATELALIREACRLTDVSMDVFRKAARVGRRQAEAVAEAVYEAKRAGADDTNTPFAAGIPWEWGFYRGGSVFREGDMVAAEFNAVYKGYYGQVCRTWVLGKPTPEQRKMYETALEASQRMGELLKPGVSGEELWRAGMEVIERAGYEYCNVRFGHGMGLTMAEGVDFIPGDKRVLQENYYVAVHPMVFQPDVVETGNGAIIGDSYWITHTGSERLTKAIGGLEIL